MVPLGPAIVITIGLLSLGSQTPATAPVPHGGEASTDPLDPALVLKRAGEDAHAGRELPAIAWFRCYLALAPAAPDRDAVLAEILRLQVRAEARIRRILQEGSEGVLQAGDVSADALAEVQQLAVLNAMAAGKLDEARATALTVEEARRDALWSAVAGALAAEGDHLRAAEAASNVTDAATRDTLKASLAAVASASNSAAPPARQWEALARELSARPEIVKLDNVLGDIAKGDARMIPIRLMEIGSALRAWFATIQRMADALQSRGHDK